MQASNRYRVVFALLLLISTVGCRCAKRAKWNAPEVAYLRTGFPTKDSVLAKAELALTHALALEAQGNPACVDSYFQSARLSWCEIQRQINEHGCSFNRASEIYRSALAQLISTGQSFNRLDPRRGLEVCTTAGSVKIPTSYRGFPWKPSDFEHLIPVGQYSTKDLKTQYRCPGLGISTVVVRCRKPNEAYRTDQQAFAATVVLRPVESETSLPTSPFVLELYDPLRVSSISVTGRQIDLERDITAPLAYRLSQADRGYLTAFLQPGSNSKNTGLFMIEPYQPGKIPIVFVHGLLSDPFTWVNMANELRARPELVERYQIWGYQYPTGEPFLISAAGLRHQLQEIQSQYDPYCSDEALNRTVLVGHSMGGLISKLQITCSGSQLWDAVSCRPLENIFTTPETRSSLAESFYFDPLSMVSRVVFIGTPHRGSPWAKRPVGRLGSKLVDEPSVMQDRHQQLIRDNPGVFTREFTKRIPTSIDLLNPNSPLLHAIDALPANDQVKLHTILGSGYRMFAAGDSDKVVPVSSAKKTRVLSEKSIHAKHTQLTKDSRGIEELICILRTHLRKESEPIFEIPNESIMNSSNIVPRNRH